ncbi:hypothetical protein HMPREF9707_01093 [Falseniella ignava CCUG 37419]|uniref:Transposase for insertion sequence element IS21-like C-terminal domain-containing protein n=1 Tax=Falseniella ignava CCUG 37419 TaxID=883112 RepID=K1LG24_9LACT|nr:hypothetical protein HMPREF9707_01093 [Falseniella ignava CCUG 37419]
MDLIHIVNDLCEEMNSEVSQATNEIPNLRREMNEKEHLHKLKKDLLKPYFKDFITRKVTNEAMVNFRQCKYSVDPRYIGKEIEVELFENEEHVHFYYNGERIRSHQRTTKKLNNHQEDLVQILKSEAMSHKEDEIQEHIRQSMKLYDLLEDETDE